LAGNKALDIAMAVNEVIDDAVSQLLSPHISSCHALLTPVLCCINPSVCVLLHYRLLIQQQAHDAHKALQDINMGHPAGLCTK
jgi:hypothetical protein